MKTHDRREEEEERSTTSDYHHPPTTKLSKAEGKTTRRKRRKEERSRAEPETAKETIERKERNATKSNSQLTDREKQSQARNNIFAQRARDASSISPLSSFLFSIHTAKA